MRVAVVTGTRRATRHGVVSKWLTEHAPFDYVFHGGAAGVDAEAGCWAQSNCVQEVVFKYWEQHGTRGGPVRNHAMALLARELLTAQLSHSVQILCVAVPDGDSRGTWDCVRALKAAGFAPTVLK